MLRIWKWYQSCLSLHPVKTQIISSGFLWGIGDVAAQYITHSTAKKRLQYHKDDDNEFKVNWKRVAVTSMFGFGFVGPVGHFWSVLILFLSFLSINQHYFCFSAELYLAAQSRDDVVMRNHTTLQRRDDVRNRGDVVTRSLGRRDEFQLKTATYEGLDKFIKMRLLLRPKSARFVAAKVAMDGLIFGPFDLFVFFTYMGFSAGKSTAQVKEDVKRDFLPALILEGGVWPIVQVANFRYVPVRYQLLYVNIFCLLDSAFLSWIEQQKDAPWKQRFTSFTSMKEGGGQGRL
ncbi:hypothetical protein Gohar_002334 [Gossypium harknessii]|uniref:Uncharacterized protein n=1 Tax=Gossypium harknessii TaxID=34285 RepID=A0A7J9HKH2_9ROSI|nr:hypothetical protein [Gossypium harknessii]